MDTYAHSANMAERHARMLGRLAEIGMELAEDLRSRALCAENAADAERLTGGFHKMARSVRQSLALEARLVRDAERARRDAVLAAEADTQRPAQRRRTELKTRLDRLVWTEAEDEPTARHWQAGIGALLAEAELDPAFADEPVEAQVERLMETIRDTQAPNAKGQGRDRLVVMQRVIVDAEINNGEPTDCDENWKPIIKSSPLGEGDPEGVEGVEPPAALPESPLSPSGTAPLQGEQLYDLNAPVRVDGTGYPIPPLRRPMLGLRGEYPPWEEEDWQNSA